MGPTSSIAQKHLKDGLILNWYHLGSFLFGLVWALCLVLLVGWFGLAWFFYQGQWLLDFVLQAEELKTN